LRRISWVLRGQFNQLDSGGQSAKNLIPHNPDTQSTKLA
jgi:hypothetical protein